MHHKAGLGGSASDRVWLSRILIQDSKLVSGAMRRSVGVPMGFLTAAAASPLRVPVVTSALTGARTSIPLMAKPTNVMSKCLLLANIRLQWSPYYRILGCAITCRKLSIAGAGMSPDSLPAAYHGDSGKENDTIPAVAASKSAEATVTGISVDRIELSVAPVAAGLAQMAPPPPRRKARPSISTVGPGTRFSTGDQHAAASAPAMEKLGASAPPTAAGIAGADTKSRHTRRRTTQLEGIPSASAAAAASSLLSGSYNSNDKASGSTAGRRLRRIRHRDGDGGGLVGADAAAAAAAASVQQPGGDGVPVVAVAAPFPLVTFSSKMPRGSSWSGVRHWVVFSDLHVRESSLATCLEVLRAVHGEARRRSAGVIFLGDFWDRRGALPVEPLNQVLQEMSSWSCPVLMLVGNHDQVDLGGLQHGLTPLELACPHVHVFDEPTLWQGALWLPYRREASVIERAIMQAVAAAAEEEDGVPGGEGKAAAPPLNAIFLHADVRTARSNRWRQAEEGIEPGAFPPHLPVFSGHYHLPHTVRGTNITYVGSPYQVSMSEASESKRLLVLEAPSWKVVEEIPLAIGPRHVRLSGPAACDQLRHLAEVTAATDTAADSAEGSDGDATRPCHNGGDESGSGANISPAPAPAPAPGPGTALRQGDRVKLWLSAAEAQDERVIQAMDELERAGVSVEQVLQPEVRLARVQAAEGMSANEMIDLYCSGCGGRGEALSPEAEAVVRAALAQARDLEGAGGYGEGTMGRCVELELDSVRVRGFGPFVEEQTYPLSARGVRVIVGENHDEPGADSNGAGKTSLVTAPLWALTGEVLSRTESGGGGRVPIDVMRNDLCGSCMVALTGRLNGAAFEVVREVKRGKTSSLTLRLGDENLTLQDISGTAERIRRLFGTDLLRCAAFFGQNDITGLLEANDAMLKQKLGLVVDLEVWEVARQLLAEPRKAAAAAAAVEAGRARVLAQQRTRRVEEVEELRRLAAEWEAERERRLEERRALLADRATQAVAAAVELQPHALAAERLASKLRRAASAAGEELRRWEAELAAQRAARQVAEVANTSSSGLHSRSPMPSPTQQREQQQQQQQQKMQSAALLDTTTLQQQRQQEQEAVQVLLESQADEARMQQALLARQSAASQALGRLRQLEASLREYQAAVATASQATKRPSAAAAAAAATSGAPAALGTCDVSPAGQVALLQLRRGGSGDEGHKGGPTHNHDGNSVGLPLERRDRGSNGRDDDVDPTSIIVTAHPHHSASAILAVCDRCRQPISEEQYAANIERLQEGIGEAKKVYDNAAGEEQEALAARAAAASRVSEANAVVLDFQRRRAESERRAAAEALAVAAAAEREARAEAEAARRAREAAWKETEALLWGLQKRMAASSAARGDLLAAAADLERVILELDQAASTWSLYGSTALRDTAAAGDATTVPAPSYNRKSIKYVSDELDDQPQDEAVSVNVADGNVDCPAPAAASRASGELLMAAKEVTTGGRGAALAVVRGVEAWREATAALNAVLREVNLQSGLLDRAQRELADLEEQVAQAEAARAAVDVHSAALTDADRALGRNGIPSLILEDVLAQLQAYTARFLNELCDGFVLELTATKPAIGGAGGGGSSGRRSGVGASREKEEIHKAVKVRNSADGSLRQRDVRQLSGGERRRTALAMCLGFEELVRRRRRLVCNVMVLDEVLQQLDNTGCELVAQVLRDLPHESVLVVGQTNSSVTSNFDLTDVVVKQGGMSYVRVAA
ncbi:hypothetical protein VaNZ11_000347 [Volvox africanus]|uniref:Calcineurin-like phosphoesterase domain-containing protein n=1 Tax=Volvox africanus TaxID=51714 RepID=A0ABQ5RMV0_9CHLO|nr:hypothetical protein VaNZ11_000347 [Volvox africanus]